MNKKMSLKKFAFCACFFEKNIYIKSWNAHVTFLNDEQFLTDYKGASDSGTFSALNEARDEVARRKKSKFQSSSRREVIRKNYFSGHFDSGSEVFVESFRKVEQWAEKSQISNSTLPLEVTSPFQNVYLVRMFTREFCLHFINTLKPLLAETRLQLERPNSMNKNGILLDDLPFMDNFTNQLRMTVSPIVKKLYPEFVGDFDSHKAFTVFYSCEEGHDKDLALHFDNSEATLNLSLSDDHEGGELIFHNDLGGLNAIEHTQGVALFHLGRHKHQALPVTNGQRWNLIMWLRSSVDRNKTCPMCFQPPRLLPAPNDSMGDGFTLTD